MFELFLFIIPTMLVIAILAIDVRGITRSLREHELWLLNEWYEDKLAKYPNAETSADELYNGVAGATFMRFMQCNAKEDVDIKQSHMIKFLQEKGHRSNLCCGVLHFHGIRHIRFGSVRNRNYST